jgi:hypothetical protein
MTRRHFYAVLIVLASLAMVHVAHIAHATAQGYPPVFVPGGSLPARSSPRSSTD